MNQLRILLAAVGVAGIFAIAGDSLAADLAKDTKDGKQPTIIDAGGKEVVLRKWKIVGGTRKLGWLPGDKADYFELREFGSTTFKEGVLSFVPMSRIESIKYDYDKETASVQLAGLEKPLQGTTKFKDINMITIEAEVDQGNLGVADLRYRGGVIKTGFKEVNFADAKAPGTPPPAGDLFSFLVVPDGKDKPGAVMTATNVQGLYHFADGSEKLLPFLMFKKTLKVDIGTIAKMHVGDQHIKEKTAECEVSLKDGMQLSITLLSHVSIDGKSATLVGLLGGTPVGWRLFPIHTFTEFQPGELKPEAPPKIEPKKKKSEPKNDDPKI